MRQDQAKFGRAAKRAAVSAAAANAATKAARPAGVEALEDRVMFAVTPLAIGTVQYGEIESPTASDVFTFRAGANDRIQITTRDRGGTNFLGHYELWQGSRQLAQWNGNFQYRSEPGRPLGVNGAYELRVTDRSADGTGRYSVGLEGLSPISPAPTPLVKGSVTPVVSIDDPIEFKQFVFTAAAGDKVELATVAGGGTAWLPHFELIGPRGNTVEAWNGKYVARLDQKIADNGPGQYVLQVSDRSNDGTGTLQIGFEGLSPNSPGATPLAIGGVSATQSITHPIDFRQYTIDARAGDLLRIATLPGAGTNWLPHFEVFSPTGVSLGEWNGHYVQGLTATVTGRYTVLVSDRSNDGTGDFQIGVESVKPASPDARTLVNGAAVSATTTNPIQFDQYRFTAAGTSVTIDTATGPGRNWLPHFEVFNSAGVSLGEWNGAASQTIPNLTAGGEYLLQVSDRSLDGAGTYTVNARGLRTPPPPPPANTAPTIASLSAAPSPVFSGTPITLTAGGIADAQNNVKQVQFYRESNNVAGLQRTGANQDVLVGTDTSGAGGWSVNAVTTGLAPKAYTFYAVATDVPGLTSNVVSRAVTVQPPVVKPLIGLSAIDGSAAESLFGTTGSTGSVLLTRGVDKGKPVTVTLQLGGSAAYGADYTVKVNGATSSYNAATKRLTVTLAANATIAELLVTPNNDAALESNETVTVSVLANAAYAVDGAKGSATVTIADKPRV